MVSEYKLSFGDSYQSEEKVLENVVREEDSEDVREGTTYTLTSVSLLSTMNLGKSHYPASFQSFLCKDSLGGQTKEDSKWGLG